MERFVRNLFFDAAYRQEFLANPEASIASSGLVGADLDAVQRVSGNLRASLSSPSVVRRLDPMIWDCC